MPTSAQIAEFGTAGTATTINLNLSGNAVQQVGQVRQAGGFTRTILNGTAGAGTGGTLRVNGVGGTLLENVSTNNLVFANGLTRVLNVGLGSTGNINVTNSGNITISSLLTSSVAGAGFTKTGSGLLVLGNTGNNYSGATAVSGGRLVINAVGALSSSSTSLSVTNAGRLSFGVNGNHGAAAGTLTLSPNQTATAALDNAQLNDANGSTATFLGNVALNADSRISAVGAGSLALQGNLSGSGLLLKGGTGNLVIGGTNNTATGGTRIEAGTVTVNLASRLGTGALTLAQQGTNNTALTLNNPVQSVGSLSSTFSGAGAQTQTITLNGTALTVNQTVNATYGNGAVAGQTATITGTGSLIKQGAATLTLTGANSYTGGTSVNAGTLLVNNQGGSGTGFGAVTVNAGATLGGAGSVAGDVVLDGTAGNLAVLSPGPSGLGSTGTLSLGSLSANPFSSLVIEASSLSDFDLVAVTGSAAVAGTLVLNFAPGFALQPGESFAFLTAGSVTGTFDTVIAPAGVIITYRDDAILASAAPVPEPGTLAYGTLVLVSLASLQSFRVRVTRRLS